MAHQTVSNDCTVCTRQSGAQLKFRPMNYALSGFMSHPGSRGSKPGRESSPSVLGPSLTHMMTHGIETNVISLIYNGVLYKIYK
jgi:hypothetical protein